MSGQSAPTKTSLIVGAMRSAITSGEFSPGSRLPRMRELSARFNASLAVVNHAINQLEREGRIVRRPRSGVFVRSSVSADRDALLSRSVLVAMPTHGHVYTDLQSNLLTTIDEAGFTPCTINSKLILDSSPKSPHRQRLDQFLASEIFGIISVGSNYWQYPYLEGYPREKRVILLEYDYPTLNCNAVLVDYESGYYQLTRHLIECGCRQIIFSSSEDITRSSFKNFHHFQQMRNGYERALRENNLMAHCRYLSDFNCCSDDEAVLRLDKLLTSKYRPDAIVSYMDVQAAQLMRAAERLGCRVPEDLRITGFYNTPWSYSQGMQLITTMDIGTEVMARKAMEILSHQSASPRVIFLKPQLVPGFSTLGPNLFKLNQ